jgi:hypothetical protein
MSLNIRGRTSRAFCAGGGYTNTDPESRRIRVAPNEVQGRVKVKVVYVVLEAQYQASISAGGFPALLR